MTDRAIVAAGAAAGEAIRAGRYAHTEVDLSGVKAGAAFLELSLTVPFGALISELLEARPFRVAHLALDYVASERLASHATFSVKVTELRGRDATLSLLIYRGSRMCVRGRANVVLGAAGAGAAPERGSNGKSSEHVNGGSR
jgi:hypothetical protein